MPEGKLIFTSVILPGCYLSLLWSMPLYTVVALLDNYSVSVIWGLYWVSVTLIYILLLIAVMLGKFLGVFHILGNS